MKIIKEYINWKGDWIPDKKDPFDKAREYDIKKDFSNELIVIIKKYQDKLSNKIVLDVLNNIINKKFNL
jgi:hypothetical protein